jgi:hypothetical protein
MARAPRSDVFDPAEIALAHITQRCVRRCYLMGDDPVSGKNYDHRKLWLEQRLQRFAACFGIDLICFAVFSQPLAALANKEDDQQGRFWNDPLSCVSVPCLTKCDLAFSAWSSCCFARAMASVS